MRRRVPVEAALIPLETVGDDDALLVEVVQRGAIVRLLRAARERDVVVRRVAGVQQRVLPVGVRRAVERSLRRRQLARGDLLL